MGTSRGPRSPPQGRNKTSAPSLPTRPSTPLDPHPSVAICCHPRRPSSLSLYRSSHAHTHRERERQRGTDREKESLSPGHSPSHGHGPYILTYPACQPSRPSTEDRLKDCSSPFRCLSGLGLRRNSNTTDVGTAAIPRVLCVSQQVFWPLSPRLHFGQIEHSTLVSVCCTG